MSHKSLIFLLFIISRLSAQNIALTNNLDSLLSEAKALVKSKRATEARALYQNIAAAAENRADWQRYALCMNALGECCDDASQYDAGEQAFRAGIAVAERRLGPSPDNPLPNLYIGLAYNLIETDRLNEAKGALEKAQSAAKRQLPEGHKTFGTIYSALGNLYFYLQQYENARNAFRTSLGYIEKNSGPDSEEALRMHTNLSIVAGEMYNYPQALHHLQIIEKWLNKYPEKSKHPVIATSFYSNMGSLMRNIGDPEKALEYYKKGMSIGLEQLGFYHRLIAYRYYNMGIAYAALQQWDNAVISHQNAIAIADSIWKRPHDLRAIAWCELANIYAQKGDETSAAASWTRAIQEAKATEDPRTLHEAYALLAKYYKDRKNYDQAIAHIDLALDIIRKHEGNVSMVAAELYNHKGDLLNLQGKHTEALSCIQQALQTQCAPATAFDAYDNPPDSSMLLVINAIWSMSYKSDALYGMWKNKPSDIRLLENAFIASQGAIRFSERFQQQNQGGAEENYDWATHSRALYMNGIKLSYLLYEKTGNDMYRDLAFELSGRSKAALLLQGVQHAQAKAFAGVPDSLLQQEADLGRDIAYYERQVANAFADADSLNAALYRDQFLFPRKRSYEALIQKMERDYPAYYALRHNAATPAAQQIAARLEAEALYAEYATDDENNLYIFSISKNEGLRADRFPLAPDCDSLIREFAETAQSIYINRPDKYARFTSLGNTLYRQYIGPIESRMAGKKRLIVVGEGAMQQLPFELLQANASTRALHQLPYLLRQVDVSYQYTSSLFMQQTPRNTEGGVLAFAPVFGSYDAPDAIALRNRNITAANVRALNSDGSFTPLFHSEYEARNIAGQFGPGQADLLLYKDATERNLKKFLQQKRRIAHIATHSFANLEYPRFSGIACASDKDRVEDDILYVNEIYNLKIPADLVVLSSCESGLGKISAGEGMLGINRAFAYAGVPNIVYSLWKVNDKAGSELMIEFYKHIRAGKSYSAALRAAKLKMLENPATALPNLWAGFLLMGR